jgi:small GTP-binding protein
MEIRCKISLLGNERVGKTSLILRYVKNSFSADYKTTLGADFVDKIYTNKILPELADKDRLVLTIWDLAGQGHFVEISCMYIQGSSAIFLVFDQNNRKSFDELGKWKKIAEQYCKDAMIKVIANKSDLENVISESEIKAKEKELGVPIEFASAKLAVNVTNVFENAVKELLDQKIKLKK